MLPLHFLGHPDFLAFGDYYITLLTGNPAEMFVSPPGDLGWGVVGFRWWLPQRCGRGTCIRGWNVLFHDVGDCICRTGGLPRDIIAAGFEASWLQRMRAQLSGDVGELLPDPLSLLGFSRKLGFQGGG